MAETKRGPVRQDRLADVDGIISRGNLYFEEMNFQNKAYTIGGFCSAAGVTREQFLRYGNPDERNKAKRKMRNKALTEFFEDARLKIMANLEERCLDKNATGAIFLLKANYGYDDGNRRDTAPPERDAGNPFKGEVTINIRTVK